MLPQLKANLKFHLFDRSPIDLFVFIFAAINYLFSFQTHKSHKQSRILPNAIPVCLLNGNRKHFFISIKFSELQHVYDPIPLWKIRAIFGF